MASTGEVACIGDDFSEALLKSLLSVGFNIPKNNVLLSTGPVESKAELLNEIKMLVNKGYSLYATKGTYSFLKTNGVMTKLLFWPNEKKRPNTIDYIKQGKKDMVINIPKNYENEEITNDYLIRRTAVDFNVPLLTNLKLAQSFITAICKYGLDDLSVKSWDEYE